MLSGCKEEVLGGYGAWTMCMVMVVWKASVLSKWVRLLVSPQSIVEVCCCWHRITDEKMRTTIKLCLRDL